MQASAENKPVLGILGGLGPMASVYFYELLTSHTHADCDSDHLDLILSSRASTPDRTAFIMRQSDRDPAPVMCEDAKRLEAAGATLLAIPCNTAHFFYEKVAAAVTIPVLNIIEETVRAMQQIGVRKIGILATEGTALSGAYNRVCEAKGLSCVLPDAADQQVINDIIYGQIKRGVSPDMTAFYRVADRLSERGCERLILGCTELSLIAKERKLHPNLFADSLEILAYRTILACGKTPTGFPEWLSGKENA